MGGWRVTRDNLLVSLVYLVCLVCFVEPDRPDQFSLVPPVSHVSALFDGYVRAVMLTGIDLVRTEQFILAKLFKPMGQPP